MDPSIPDFEEGSSSSSSPSSSASSSTTLTVSPSDDQENSDLVWAFAVIKDMDKQELKRYLDFAASACIPGGGCDIEQALDVLYKCQGSVMQATRYLLSRELKGQTIWTLNEKQSFERSFNRHPKDFRAISRDLKTKTVKDCVRYYYITRFQRPAGGQRGQQQEAIQQQQEQDEDIEVFPCKVCGREFPKIKSRSAHMKRHKNERLYG